MVMTMTNDNHDPLRDLIHQSLVSDKLAASMELRSELEQRLDDEVVISPAKPPAETKPRRRILRAWHVALVVTAALVVMVYFSLPEKWQRADRVIGWTFYPQSQRSDWRDAVRGVESVSSKSNVLAANKEPSLSSDTDDTILLHSNQVEMDAGKDEELVAEIEFDSFDEANVQAYGGTVTTKRRSDAPRTQQGNLIASGESGHGDLAPQTKPASGYFSNRAVGGASVDPEGTLSRTPEILAGSPGAEPDYYGMEKGAKGKTFTFNGKTTRAAPGVNDPTDPTAATSARSLRGYVDFSDEQLAEIERARAELAVEQSARRSALATLQAKLALLDGELTEGRAQLERRIQELTEAPGTEQYDAIHDNPFLPVKDAPLSTFSIDVDTASYANVRRFLTQGQIPPADAVRIEELLNYFSYDYPAPKGEEPFSVNMETAPCPWRQEHLLLRVGLRGKEVHKAERPASNLVFLIDTSGSMSDEDKLPLVKQAMSMLTGELGDRDRITIVTYAGEAGLKLAPTNGSDRATITSVINSLNSNGSTHGSAGIQLAYEKAREQFIKEGTNRVILCTDGDLNVGITQDDQLVDLISKEAKSGVFLTVLGFGQGNLKDSKMEKLADHGNGIYAYIDGVREAKKVLVDQIAGTLETIAKDVKIQIEFNPAQVRGYRLIGYENRVLAAKDFNDDTKDAGEIGAGHTVTALYELVPAGAAEPKPVVEELKYQGTGVRGQESGDRSQKSGDRGQNSEVKDEAISKELLTLKLRFKQPDGDVSKKIEYPLSEKGSQFRAASADFRFAASVAAFGMILRNSPYRGAINMSGVGEIAATSLGDDARGYRAEFLDLVRRAEKLGKR
jgi:Ca-activated chloride channel family protein